MKRRLARLGLRVTRWSSDGLPPDEPKYVTIAAPHTTNWDLLYLLLHAWSHGLRISWLGKDTLFRGPAGWVLRGVGGIPVRRDRRSGMVASIADEFRARPELIVVIPPEGTRKAAPRWKSGFYEIAVAADVPIVCSYLDYARRVGGFGPVVRPTGDIEADMVPIREFYTGIRGKYPDRQGEIVVRRPAADGAEPAGGA